MENKKGLIKKIKDYRLNKKLSKLMAENERLKKECEMEYAYEEGFKIGYQEGKEIRRIIVNMLKKKMDYHLIAEITNVSVNDIRKIEEKMD